MPISPNSFSMMAKRRPCSEDSRMWLRSVVLPLPRKPVRIVTGILLRRICRDRRHGLGKGDLCPSICVCCPLLRNGRKQQSFSPSLSRWFIEQHLERPTELTAKVDRKLSNSDKWTQHSRRSWLTGTNLMLTLACGRVAIFWVCACPS